MFKMVNKRGLSPVIATVLLITLAIIIAVIIFLWARSFITEIPQKFDDPIEDACKDVIYDAEIIVDANGATMSIVNKGNVPIYKLSILQKKSTSLKNIGEVKIGVEKGKTITGAPLPSGSYSEGDKFIVKPVLLGEVSTLTKEFLCDNKEATKEIIAVI